MQADYLDAHERHWEDAEHLFQSGRWANADHLYGLAAECGLKKLMLAFGMSYDTSRDRPDNKKDRVHADGVWARFESYRCRRPQGARYVLAVPNPFSDWHISQRYAHQSNFGQDRVQKHQAGAASVRRLIRQAQKEGLI
ncbi:SAM-dependent methyltransferase [Chloracidobacterium aggregatum]|uniref:SAM-dependent methyltransferase n=1 Tax=Chloracidobacterium sp. N TaxID=2821540 RepID=A0ABX8B4Q1_9BACT|nr:SAM-dependent methyltransferase [Chloracidobacterium aggregatum]QUV86535.1 SAM-dependent methyltransferase [Chloracidobacterium sp. 2]QUV89034.1 SAM-dependent methyltransferase [Chloracidobacterium sp. S]QUV92158.1 SAM-dependent methyltransferase [Chloracidobacterium sp. A]QUV95433.1 SAM-dependent methyltransferase [Chloracidobacterium sp. N]QUV98655.1 SAM-dependent methyltransferase [Chloracidobacterium sp. E]